MDFRPNCVAEVGASAATICIHWQRVCQADFFGYDRSNANCPSVACVRYVKKGNSDLTEIGASWLKKYLQPRRIRRPYKNFPRPLQSKLWDLSLCKVASKYSKSDIPTLGEEKFITIQLV